VSQHPVTTECGQGERQVSETLQALHELRMPTVILSPNVDAGSEDIARGMRKFREQYQPEYIRFYKNFPVETYVRLMRSAACLVGNSSASIREGSFLGTPAVDVGNRQTAASGART
jgi:UDP-N-acetylglucosamine 2-epimerase